MAEASNAYRHYAQLAWDTRCLRDNPALLAKTLPLSPRALQRAYPTSALRYWFIYHFLRIESQQLRRAPHVCEVGIDNGQMLQFMHAVGSIPHCHRVECASWTGVDCRLKQDELAAKGYSQLIETNVERCTSWLHGECDAVVLLHVLEHLYDPETVLADLVERMRPGAVLIGGFPSVPHWCAGMREAQVRANPNPNGHVSKFSPRRVKNFVAAQNLQLEFLSGAFFLRASGMFLEDRAWWLRCNLAFGALFPSWPGEIYWVIRKPIR